jgi:DNA-binding transcriptional LysR family regulator
MTSPRDVLTPDSLSMLHAIEKAGSFAAAARTLGLVPSALTYRVRQIEDALDVLLFDRSSPSSLRQDMNCCVKVNAYWPTWMP